MAYIQPDSTILICKDIPLNASYDDTLTFYDSNGSWDYTAQYNYFASKTSQILTKEKYSIVRERQGILRVEGDVGKWETVNYMVFTNKNFLDKHFYAFINKAEYVNPNTTFLYFQLDVMQTWLGDIKFKESLIEREHVEDDSLYANLEDEGIQVQERLPYDASVNFEPYIGRKMLVIGATESYESIKNSYSQISYNPSVDYPKINVFDWDYDISVINDKNYFDIDKAINYDKSKKVFNVLNSINEFSFMVMKSGLKVEYYRVYAKYNETNSKWEFSEYVEMGDSNG